MLIRFSSSFRRTMSKRSLAALSASPSRQNKKAKLSSTGQSRLDSFFGASSRPTPDTARPVSKPAPRSQSSKPSALSGSEKKGKQKAVEKSPSDEEFAWALAAADGLDLETLRRLESRGSSANLSSAAVDRSRLNPHPTEVIDVDALSVEEDASLRSNDTNHACAGPAASASTSASTSAFPGPSSSTESQFISRSPLEPERSCTTARTIGNRGSLTVPTYGPLNVDPPTYDPDSAAAACAWPPNAPVPYSFLAHALATLSATRSRIAKLDTLTNALRTICRQHPESLLPALYLLSNSLSPSYSPIELGLGPSIISKALQHVSGLSSAALKRLYNATGDPGEYPLRALPLFCKICPNF